MPPTPEPPDALTPLAGQFWRILYATDLPRLLLGAKTPEGRFHHSGQPALYLSPSPTDAAHAIATYLKPDDPPRIIVPLTLTVPRIADLRRPACLATLRLTGHESATPWQPQRAAGQPATTWAASDAARAAGADGMIYTARSAPTRWHLVLFHWTDTTLRQNGPAQPFLS